jgi:fructose-1,6-bisphosphatase
VDPLSSNNFIGPCLRNLIEVCETQGSKGDRKKVGQRALKLKTLIEQTFLHSTNEEEDDEYAPQIINDFEFV